MGLPVRLSGATSNSTSSEDKMQKKRERAILQNFADCTILQSPLDTFMVMKMDQKYSLM